MSSANAQTSSRSSRLFYRASWRSTDTPGLWLQGDQERNMCDSGSDLCLSGSLSDGV